MHLRQSTTAEKPLQASKWLDYPALLSAKELANLFDFLHASIGIFFLYPCGVVCRKGQEELPQKQLLKAYENYILCLMNGQIPDQALYRSEFSPAMTVQTDALFTIPVGTDRHIIRASKPVVQLQAHNIDYSPIDKKFHSMVFGLESIAWGIQFSYPQLYRDHATGLVETIKNTEDFPNTALFHFLQKWMREHTVPTPFVAEGRQINAPIRLGKECFPWINRHPQLIKNNIAVKT